MTFAATRCARAFLLVTLVVTALLMGGAGTASAHAVLTSSDPAREAVLEAAPQRVSLTFSETVVISDESVRVLDPEGNRADTGKVRHVGDDTATARVPLRPGLPDGTFTVVWKAVSADSHPIAGAFTFSIGEPSETTVEPPRSEAGGGVVGRLYDLARFLAYTGYVLLVGASAFVLVCWPHGAARRPVRRLLLGGWSVLLAATMVKLMLRGPYESGGGLKDALDLGIVQDTLDTKSGTALAVRVLLLAGAGAFLALLVGQSRRGVPPPDVRMGLISGGAVLAVGLAGTWASVEHASVGIQVGAAVPVDVVHMVAMALWLGGLATLLAALFLPAGLPLPTAAVHRFSRVAQVCVAALMATGAYQAWRQLGSWSAFLSTDYGRLLLAKLAAVALLVGIAGYSRRWTRRLDDTTNDTEREDRHKSVERRATAKEADTASRLSTEASSTEPAPAKRPRQLPGDSPPGTHGQRGGVSPAGDEDPMGDGKTGKKRGGKGEVTPRAAQLARQRAAIQTARARRERNADPHRVRLRVSVFVEVGVAIVALILTTFLTTTEPGRTTERAFAAGTAPTVSGPATVNVLYDTGGTNGRGKAELTVDPARSGKNELHAYLTDGAGQPVDVPGLTVTLRLPKQGIGPLDVRLKHLDVGHWTANNVQLPMRGTWQVSVTVRTSEIDQVTETEKVRIG